MSYPPGKRADI